MYRKEKQSMTSLVPFFPKVLISNTKESCVSLSLYEEERKEYKPYNHTTLPRGLIKTCLSFLKMRNN